MQIKEHNAKPLTREVLEEYINKNKINFNLYGISDNLLFIIKDDQMAVLDVETNQYVIPYTKKLLRPFIDSNSGNKKIIAIPSDELGPISWKSDILRPHPAVTTFSHFKYSTYDEFGRQESDSSYRYIDTDDFFRRNSFESLNLNHDSNFDSIYPCDVLPNLQFYERNPASAKLIVNDKWDAQSKYRYGLSIFYKDGLYGVCDTNYNVLFDYDKDINYIKIISSDLLFVRNSSNLSSIYNIHSGYIIPFKYPFDSVNVLDKNILKVHHENKYRYILNGQISDKEYDSISYDRGILILSNKDNHIFMDSNGNILYRKKIKTFYKSKEDIYFPSGENIIKHNLYTGVEFVIQGCDISNEFGPLDSYDIDALLEKYKYYYKDRKGKITLFETMKYGISIEENGIRAYRWYDTLKKVYEFQKSLLSKLLNSVPENPPIDEHPKKYIKGKEQNSQ